jgi:hypothetical protein
MSKFIKRKNLPKQEKRVFLKQGLPFDVNANFTDNFYDLPLQSLPLSKNYSLKELDKNSEFLQNPNIVDLNNFNRTKNSKLELNDKFDNVNDPIFDFDEQRDILSLPIKRDIAKLDKVKAKLSTKGKSSNMSNNNKNRGYSK